MNASPTGVGPLSDEDLNRLDVLLEELNPDGAMLLEEIDGFFTALVCNQGPADASRYAPEVLGLDDDVPPPFQTQQQADEFGNLLNRHWASIELSLRKGEGFAPILMHDDQGNPGGNLWAIGFLRGISMAPQDWESIEDDEELSAMFEPFETLAEELDLETGDAVNPVPADQRQELIDAMAEAAFEFYAWFHETPRH